jgi:PEGA domain-containing protein
LPFTRWQHRCATKQAEGVMRGSSLVTTVVLAGALSIGAPAFAQRGGGGGGHRGGGGHVGGMHMGGAPGVPRGTAGVRGGAWRGGRAWNVAPNHYFHPYYAFHPHASLGFGLWAGYPFSWAYPFYYPPYPYYPNYPYYPYPYAPAGPGYSSHGSTAETVDHAAAQPDQSNLGGMSFEITPSDAQVFVDGNYVGTAGQFTPTTQPLGVPSGRHQVEIRDAGYKTMSFDVDIVAGQVIPYQGQMER